MKIIATYIVYAQYKNHHFDDEYIKLHELESGDFIKEDWKGKLNKYDRENALKLIFENKK